MKKNVGTLDRLVRLGAALVIVGLYVTEVISGALGLGLLALAAVLGLTGAVGFCGLYRLFGINTCPIKRSDDGK